LLISRPCAKRCSAADRCRFRWRRNNAGLTSANTSNYHS
jgi:hypothetical protein